MATDRTEEGDEAPPPEEEPRQPRPAPQPRRREPEPAGRAPEPSIKPGSISRTLGTVALTALAVLVLYTAYQHSRRDDGDGNGNRADASDDTTETTASGPDDSMVATTLAETGPPVDPECPPREAPAEPVRRFSDPPPMCIAAGRSYVATVETTRGAFEITLDADAAPQAVNNFVFLARWGFYEGAGFHRVVPDFVIDTGDPVGDPAPGLGGPGYSIDVEPPPTGERPYPLMSVTTVRVADQATGTQYVTNGSQFSIVTGREAETAEELVPEAWPTVFGRVTSGEEVVEAIDATGTDHGVPLEDTVIESITIRED